MPYSKFPPDVIDFLMENIHSIEQLDVLLLLRQQRDRNFTVHDVNKIIQSSPESLSKRLSDFAEIGLVARNSDKEDTFRYQPRDPLIDSTIASLASAYKDHRIKITELIYSKPIREMHSFSSAFRFKKENKDG